MVARERDQGRVALHSTTQGYGVVPALLDELHSSSTSPPCRSSRRQSCSRAANPVSLFWRKHGRHFLTTKAPRRPPTDAHPLQARGPRSRCDTPPSVQRRLARRLRRGGAQFRLRPSPRSLLDLRRVERSKRPSPNHCERRRRGDRRRTERCGLLRTRKGPVRGLSLSR
jgi:hypothetical protein